MKVTVRTFLLFLFGKQSSWYEQEEEGRLVLVEFGTQFSYTTARDLITELQ